MKTFEIKKPSTVRVKFSYCMPLFFEVRTEQGKLFYFRDLEGKKDGLKFNVNRPGIYFLSDDCSCINISPIEINTIKTPLPTPQRNFDKPDKFVVNENLKHTPARIFAKAGRVEVSRKFLSYPKPVQDFILLHEEGHRLYKDEDKADLYALKKYIEQGGNNSMAYFTLKNILNNTPEKQRRIDNLLKNVNYENK